MKATGKKCLIAFFSRKGQNYVSGRIVDLKIGNTEVVAQMIQKKTGGDLFPIETVAAYPNDYTETTDVAKNELRTKARPKLKRQVENMEVYDIIFLGYPNWWGAPPMAVFTFLEGYDFSGKTIVPFCTHEGSGMGHSESDIKEICPGATMLNGLSIRGRSVQRAENDVSAWLRKSGVIA